MMYSEFAAATKCSNTEHNREVFHHLEALYMMSDMTKEEVYRIGRKLVVNPVVYNTRIGRQGKEPGRYVFVSNGATTPNGCYYIGTWAEVMNWNISIATGITTYKLRYIDNNHEAYVAVGWDSDCSYTIDLKVEIEDGKTFPDSMTKGHDSWGVPIRIKWVNK